VGVTALSLDPSISNVAVEAAQVPNAIVAAADTEQIISLEPDMVFVASFTAPEVIQQLRDAGLTVFATGFPVGLDPIRENILLLGQAVGADEEAAAMAADMDAQIAAIRAAVGEQETPVRAMYLTPGNYAGGVDSTISGIIAAAGGIDVSAAAGVSQLNPVSDEFIIEQDPDVILLSGWTPWDPTFVDTFKNNAAFADLSAIKNNRVYVVSDAHLTTVSQFVTEGVKDAAAYLYPERYPVFPLTITDAAGTTVDIENAPQTVYGIGESTNQLLEQFVNSLGDTDFEVSYLDEGAQINEITDTTLIFSDEAAAAGTSNTVVLYDGDIPAEQIANTMIISEALGERVAALNWIAQFSDELDARAAGS
jgi:iron complex transport system substrate-binding protein